jgi:hypothetical protein
VRAEIRYGTDRVYHRPFCRHLDSRRSKCRSSPLHGNCTRSTLISDPKQDLHGWLLFQGTRFQRLKNVYRLNSKEFLSPPKWTANERKKKPSMRADGPFLLGDPYDRHSSAISTTDYPSRYLSTHPH